jgi:hypothetical protein
MVGDLRFRSRQPGIKRYAVRREDCFWAPRVRTIGMAYCGCVDVCTGHNVFLSNGWECAGKEGYTRVPVTVPCVPSDDVCNVPIRSFSFSCFLFFRSG